MAKKKPLTDNKELTVVERAHKFFAKCVTHESEQRIQEMDDIRFVGLLEQWPENIRAIREGDPQGARPCLVVDKVNQYVNQIVNSIRENRPSIKARPVDDNGDIEVAEVYQGIIRHIEDASKADIAYDWAGESAVKSGLGYFRILTEYVGDSFQQEIRIARIRNRFTVYFDPNSKEPDGSDAMEVLITEKIPRKDFEAQYPDCSTSDWEQTTGDGDWYDDDTVRIAEYLYITKEKQDLHLLADGNTIFAKEYLEKYAPNVEMIEGIEPPPQIIKTRKGEKTTVNWAKVCNEPKPLDETVIPGKFIPVIPVIGIETDLDGKRYLRGIVRGVKDAQRMYNYNRSTIAESLNLTIKAPYIGVVGQFKTKGAQWASANRVNYPYLEYDPVNTGGGLAPPPQRQSFAGVPTGLLQDIQTSEHDIQAALGMYQASIGQDGNAKSGRALNAQQKAGDMATFMFPDNLSKSIRHAGRIIVGQIPFIYDTAQVVRILGEDGTADYAKIDPEQTEAITEQRDENGAIKKIYNLGVGKYDVTITTGPGYATKRMEGADFLTQLVQTSPDLMPVIGDLLFKSMDMPYSQEISDRMKRMMPAQLQDGKDGESAEVMQVKQQAKQAVDQLSQQLDAAHQAMQEAEQEAKQLKDKADSVEGKFAYDNKKLEIDRYNAETQRLKVELDAAQQEALDPARIQMIEDAVAALIDHIPAPIEPPIEQLQPEQPINGMETQ
jgi:hypothetical protein